MNRFGDLRLALSNLQTASKKYPYYRYCGLWFKSVEQSAYIVIYSAWLGGNVDAVDGKEGRLLRIEEVGSILGIPVNKDNEFHLSVEEYLNSLITLINELARLARNSVTLGNYERPIVINQFIQALHSSFQILNLKNDSLRRRFDSIKYDVKKAEEVVYDLSLHGLSKNSLE